MSKDFQVQCSRDVKQDLKDDLTDICVVGFEPNPRHTAGLLEIQDEYTKCGWSVRFRAFPQLGIRVCKVIKIVRSYQNLDQAVENQLGL